MLGWFQALMPREDRFFDLFERHSRTLVAGAEALQGVLEGGDAVPRTASRSSSASMRPTPSPARCCWRCAAASSRPFDRGDIKDLIQSMDDAIDQMNKTAKTITLFEVRTLRPADAARWAASSSRRRG